MSLRRAAEDFEAQREQGAKLEEKMGSLQSVASGSGSRQEVDPAAQDALVGELRAQQELIMGMQRQLEEEGESAGSLTIGVYL